MEMKDGRTEGKVQGQEGSKARGRTVEKKWQRDEG